MIKSNTTNNSNSFTLENNQCFRVYSIGFFTYIRTMERCVFNII